MEKTNVAIVGLGTVGSGVARLLLDHGDRTARHAGRTLWLKKAVVRDLNKPRDVDLPEGVVTDAIEDVINDPDISVVAQLVGGLEPARTIMLRLMESGKDIVTANKALLAEHGPELFTTARKLGRSIAFEAAVAGGIPIIANISQCLSANQILSLEGILNGTSNFIVTQMDEKGSPYDDVVRQAQELGYAEADPTMDVDGTDAAQKLAILAHLAFGATVDWSEIPRVGIDGLDPDDLRYARELGYRIKLLADCKLGGRRFRAFGRTDLSPDRNAVGRSPRRFQRNQGNRRRRGACLLPWSGSGPNANRIGRGSRFDRYSGWTHEANVSDTGVFLPRSTSYESSCAEPKRWSDAITFV